MVRIKPQLPARIELASLEYIPPSDYVIIGLEIR